MALDIIHMCITHVAKRKLLHGRFDGYYSFFIVTFLHMFIYLLKEPFDNKSG